MNVPFLDLARSNAPIMDEIIEAACEVLRSGQYILGPRVEDFEKAFADFLGTRFCVGVNSGTTALHLALNVLDIKPGDEIITTPLSWVSTAWAISYTGAKPVFVDIDPISYTIDPQKIEQVITPRTRAILPVHLYGHMANMPLIKEIARVHDLEIIEDAAQAHGAGYSDSNGNFIYAGCWGRLGCFSFYPTKNLGAFGEAGAVVTADPDLDKRLKALRDHAQIERHKHIEIGYNARMDALQGAFLEIKLRRFRDNIQARRELAEAYTKRLSDLDSIICPIESTPGAHAWHLYVVQLPEQNRDNIRKALSEHGIQTGIHYPTLIPFQPAYKHLEYKTGDFPVAEKVVRSILSLPFDHVLNENEIDLVASALSKEISRG